MVEVVNSSMAVAMNIYHLVPENRRLVHRKTTQANDLSKSPLTYSAKQQKSWFTFSILLETTRRSIHWQDIFCSMMMALMITIILVKFRWPENVLFSFDHWSIIVDRLRLILCLPSVGHGFITRITVSGIHLENDNNKYICIYNKKKKIVKDS